jgi:glutaredoxin
MAKPQEECPYCGERFRAGRPSCPHCGADRETGWLPAEDQMLAEVELPDGEPSEEEREQLVKDARRERRRARAALAERRPLLPSGKPLAAVLLLLFLLAIALWRAFS